MHKVVFTLSSKARIYIAILVTGLLVFVWLHWRGERTTELIVFGVLVVLATTLYSIKGEVTASAATREVTGIRRWLGLPVRRLAVCVGKDDALYLTEDITHGQSHQGISVSHRLEATGELLQRETTTPGPYIVISESNPRNRARLESFAHEVAKTLGVPLHDHRKFTERLSRYDADS